MRHENMLVKGYKNNFETRTLDSFNLEKVDILKIDVEGFECDVVEGAINTISKHKPKIIIETHGSRLRDKCTELLGSLGYRVVRKGKQTKSDVFDEVVILFFSYNNTDP
ncbi:MAG: FkbM family methyltransferase [Thermoplasmata archaeon]